MKYYMTSWLTTLIEMTYNSGENDLCESLDYCESFPYWTPMFSRDTIVSKTPTTCR